MSWRASKTILVPVLLSAGLAGLFRNSYGECLDAFFHFDDFWVLGAAERVERGLPWGVWRIFEPVHGFLLYRPLSTVGYFLVLRILFGNDPAAFHVVQLAFQVVNGVLVYAIALLVFRRQLLAVTASLVYASAPALAIAACWNSLFTVTGAAFFSYLGLLAWIGWQGPLGMAATGVCFVAALLASEHGLTLPLALIGAAVFLRVRAQERHRWTVLALWLAVSVAYALAKLLYLRFGLEADFPDPAARAFILEGYAPEWGISVALASLGTYLGYAFVPLFWLTKADASVRIAAGTLLVLVTCLAAVACLRKWHSHEGLPFVAFGLTWFLVSILPVAFLPRHVASYYGTIGACGIAVAFTATLAVCWTRREVVAAAGLAALVFVAFLKVRGQVLDSEEFRFFRNFTWAAERWVRSVSDLSRTGAVNVVSVPDSVLSRLVFEQGRAQEVLLCSRVDVQVVRGEDSALTSGHHVFLKEPFLYLREQPRHRAWLPRWCE